MPQSDSSPSANPYLITPSDTVALTPPIRSFSIAVAGNVKVTTLDGRTETWPLPAGMCPGAVRLLWSAGTTATGFVGFP